MPRTQELGEVVSVGRFGADKCCDSASALSGSLASVHWKLGTPVSSFLLRERERFLMFGKDEDCKRYPELLCVWG